MIRKYAAIAGLQRRIAIPVPVLTPWLSSHWVNLITPLPRALASSLMKSLENDVICTEHDIASHIADPTVASPTSKTPSGLALARVRDGELHTRWSRPGADDSPARPLPTDPDWAGGSLHEQVSERRVDADAKRFGRFSSRSAPSMAGRQPLRPGRCVGGSEDSPAPSGLTAGPDSRIACIPVRRWTGGASSTSTGPACCGCVPMFHCPAGCGLSCRYTRTARAAPVVASARCFSRMALPVKPFGRRPHCFATRSSAVSHVTSPRTPHSWLAVRSPVSLGYDLDR